MGHETAVLRRCPETDFDLKVSFASFIQDTSSMADIPHHARRRTYWVLRPMKANLSLHRRCWGMTPNEVVLKNVFWKRIKSTCTVFLQPATTLVSIIS